MRFSIHLLLESLVIYDVLALQNIAHFVRNNVIHQSSRLWMSSVQVARQNPEIRAAPPKEGFIGQLFVAASVTSQVLSLSVALAFAETQPSFALSEEQRLVAEAWRIVDRAYVDPTFNGVDWQATRLKAVKSSLKNKDEAYATIRSMLNLLEDPYTRFLTPGEFESLYSSAKGDVAGIGIELQTEGGENGSPTKVVIVNVVQDSPASRAGFKRGDVITNVDGVSMEGKTAEIAAALTRGTPGSTLSMSIIRPNVAEIRSILTRQVLKLQGTLSKLETTALGKKVGVIKIKFFSKETRDDVINAITSLNNQGAEAFILDLRHCPGGYFPAGVDVAKLFLPAEKTIVYVVDRNGISDYYETQEDGLEIKKQLYVVVDGKTASASEILTGALKDNKRAKIVGQTTFGKAKVQTLTQLEDGSGVAVTISRYETPLHTDINKVGIPTDIFSACDADTDTLDCFDNEKISI